MAFFNQPYKPAAKTAVGQKVVFGEKIFEIVQAQGFSRKENSTPLYEAIVDMDSGRVFCPRYRGAVLLLVACPNNSDKGGCVLIKKIKIGDVVYDGPGKVTEALGITEHRATGVLLEGADGKLTLKMG